MSKEVAFQDAIYNALIASDDVMAVVGGRIYDNPTGKLKYPYISFGSSQIIAAPADGVEMDQVYLDLHVWTKEGGSKRGCKSVLDTVVQALRSADLAVSDPHSVSAVFIPQTRVFSDVQDGIAHGVATLSAWVDG